MRPAHFHDFDRRRPNLLFPIDLRPERLTEFACSNKCQDDKLKRQPRLPVPAIGSLLAGVNGLEKCWKLLWRDDRHMSASGRRQSASKVCGCFKSSRGMGV